MRQMAELQAQIGEWRRSKDFHTPSSIKGPEGDYMLGKLMLVVTEVAEAAEAVRHMDEENFKEEIADTFIRLFDICDACGFDAEYEIRVKMRTNQQREKLHGKATSI